MMIENKIDVSQFVSEKLADIVVSNRYLGLFPALSTAAMKELSDRRQRGETFAYEDYIADNLEKLPKLDVKAETSMSAIMNKILALKITK